MEMSLLPAAAILVAAGPFRLGWSGQAPLHAVLVPLWNTALGPTFGNNRCRAWATPVGEFAIFRPTLEDVVRR